jgi:hypothetical protein
METQTEITERKKSGVVRRDEERKIKERHRNRMMIVLTPKIL